MPGALLRTGTLQEFKALGVDGQPAYTVALQLREAIRLQADRSVADCLAIPQINDAGDRIDWYAPFEGDVIPWSSAVAEERCQALADLERMHAVLREISTSMQGQERQKRVFGRLLDKALQFPDDRHVYLVAGRPVVTFWGFEGGAGELRDPLRVLRTTTAVPDPAPAVEPPAAAAAPRRRWWWWLLLLPLLILLLLYLLRGCAPEVELPLGLSEVDLPGQPADPRRQLIREHEVGGGRWIEGAPLSGEGSEVPDPALAEEPLLDPALEGALGEEGTEASAEPETPLADEELPADAEADQPPNESPEDEAAAEEPQPETDDPAAEPGAESEEGTRPEALQMPPEALRRGSTDFLDGNWKAGAGIQDGRTGKPLQLDYDFDKDGKGRVEIRRGDGVTCSGAVQAAVRGGSLAIGSQADAACSDGSSYRLPEVTCAPDARDTADCTGRYEDQEFPMSMQQDPQP